MNITLVKPLPLLLGVAIISSCTSMPDVKMSYYLPKSEVNITATQTIMCVDPYNPTVETKVIFTPVYSADRSNPQSIDFNILDTFYSSGDATITLTSDGRLASFNSSSTGSGAEVVDTIIDVVAKTTKSAVGSADVKKSCDVINKMAGSTAEKPKPLSVILTSKTTFEKSPIKSPKGSPESEPNIISSAFALNNYPKDTYDEIKAALGSLSVSYKVNKSLPDPVTDNTNKQSITVVEPASIELIVNWKARNGSESNYSESSLVPQLGFEYKLPIPDPPFFGRNDLELELYESGKVKKLRYATKDGVQNASAVLSKINKQFENEEEASNAEKAADVKAQADLIAQQQRLLRCKNDIAGCI